MIFALLSTLISSFANVFWKKTLIYKVRPYAQGIASYPIAMILSFYFIFTNISLISKDILTIIIILFILFIDILKEPVLQQVYREEKISVLIPYFNLNKIFVIITSFFLFQDVSIISFIITIFTALFIMLSAIDIKQHRFPRNFGKILFIELSRTLCILLGGWIIIQYGEISYFVIYVLLGLLTYMAICTYTTQIYDLQKLPIRYWNMRLIGALGWISWFLGLVVIKNVGVSISILLGFIGIGITLLVSYIFLKDTPAKKDIIVTIIVSILIGIGYYFK